MNEFSENKPYIPSAEFADIAQRWRMVEARHIFTFGFQALWAAFLLHLGIQKQGMTLDQFMEWGSQVLSPTIISMSMNSYLDGLCHNCHISGSWHEQFQNFDAACRISTPGNELSLYKRASSHSNDPVELFQIGTKILSLHFLRFLSMHREGNPIWLDMARRQRLPMAVYFDEMQKWLVN